MNIEYLAFHCDQNRFPSFSLARVTTIAKRLRWSVFLLHPVITNYCIKFSSEIVPDTVNKKLKEILWLDWEETQELKNNDPKVWVGYDWRDPEGVFKWHFVIEGPSDSDYAGRLFTFLHVKLLLGGYFHGIIEFKDKQKFFPLHHPKITLLTSTDYFPSYKPLIYINPKTGIEIKQTWEFLLYLNLFPWKSSFTVKDVLLAFRRNFFMSDYYNECREKKMARARHATFNTLDDKNIKKIFPGLHLEIYNNNHEKYDVDTAA